MAAHAPRRSGSSNLLVQLLLTLIAGCFFFLIFFFVTSILYQAWYRERIFPGVSMLGVDLGGLTPAEAEQVINISFPYPRNGSIKLVYQDKKWTYTPEQLGLSLDPKTSAQNASKLAVKVLISIN
jgi:hypothetical protein